MFDKYRILLLEESMVSVVYSTFLNNNLKTKQQQTSAHGPPLLFIIPNLAEPLAWQAKFFVVFLLAVYFLS